MLTLNSAQRDAIVATCIRALPNEGCGLLLGDTDGVVREVVASTNVADSAKIYEIDPKVLLRAYRRADDEGVEVIGVFHSHTHSEAYPSPTDVRQAPDPSWHYVLVSLRDVPTEILSYRVVDQTVSAEPVKILN
ncbi:MAG TPA: M67 family metallopeptidase [Acidimicrobiales bacterium]|nr:M67 family metallopeptidase [Acidimicrobiales bacterium]